MMKLNKTWLVRIGLFAVAAGLVVLAWRYFQSKEVGKGFASSNGRIEAVEIDIAAKTPGRLRKTIGQMV